eukprot:TRINITY_DN380_c0_g1_i2.p1 TRINITY_DN380_c0_g1~~TRINITY_DN380_c0_g1_i2.p1  ORF type:complete len:1069 (-),score=121.99 TRINITY_DN380_c0_g1_i2:388-3567(-)
MAGRGGDQLDRCLKDLVAKALPEDRWEAAYDELASRTIRTLADLEMEAAELPDWLRCLTIPPTGEPELDDTVQASIKWAKSTDGITSRIVNVITKLDLKPSQIKRLRYCDKTEINSTMEGEMKVGAAEWGKLVQAAEAIKVVPTPQTDFEEEDEHCLISLEPTEDSKCQIVFNQSFFPEATDAGPDSVTFVVSFVGDTAAGKSHLVGELAFRLRSRLDCKLPRRGAQGQSEPTTGDVHLYRAESDLAGPTTSCDLFLDFEGLCGKTPQGWVSKAFQRMKPDSKFLQEREAAANQQLPTLAYALSEVLVYVTREALHNTQITERLHSWAENCCPHGSTFASKPALVVIRNRCPSAELLTEQQASALKQAIWSGNGNGTSETPLESYFRELCIVTLPDEKDRKFSQRFAQLKDTLSRLKQTASDASNWRAALPLLSWAHLTNEVVRALGTEKRTINLPQIVSQLRTTLVKDLVANAAVTFGVSWAISNPDDKYEDLLKIVARRYCNLWRQRSYGPQQALPGLTRLSELFAPILDLQPCEYPLCKGTRGVHAQGHSIDLQTVTQCCMKHSCRTFVVGLKQAQTADKQLHQCTEKQCPALENLPPLPVSGPLLPFWGPLQRRWVRQFVEQINALAPEFYASLQPEDLLRQQLETEWARAVVDPTQELLDDTNTSQLSQLQSHIRKSHCPVCTCRICGPGASRTKWFSGCEAVVCSVCAQTLTACPTCERDHAYARETLFGDSCVVVLQSSSREEDLQQNAVLRSIDDQLRPNIGLTHVVDLFVGTRSGTLHVAKINENQCVPDYASLQDVHRFITNPEDQRYFKHTNNNPRLALVVGDGALPEVVTNFPMASMQSVQFSRVSVRTALTTVFSQRQRRFRPVWSGQPPNYVGEAVAQDIVYQNHGSPGVLISMRNMPTNAKISGNPLVRFWGSEPICAPEPQLPHNPLHFRISESLESEEAQRIAVALVAKQIRHLQPNALSPKDVLRFEPRTANAEAIFDFLTKLRCALSFSQANGDTPIEPTWDKTRGWFVPAPRQGRWRLDILYNNETFPCHGSPFAFPES